MHDYFDISFENDCITFLRGCECTSFTVTDNRVLNQINNNITEVEIEEAITKLKNNKAPGLDRIKAKCIKYVIFFKPHLQMLFNYVLNSENYPSSQRGTRI